jgi:hypothetical protein
LYEVASVLILLHHDSLRRSYYFNGAVGNKRQVVLVIDRIQWHDLTYSIKTSAIMFMPRNIQKRATQYMMASITGGNVVMPGSSTKLTNTAINQVSNHKSKQTNTRKQASANKECCGIGCEERRHEVFKYYLPITKFLQICVLDNSSSWKLCGLRFLVFFTLIEVSSGSHDTCLAKKYDAEE